jgi:hypothetical protein
MTVSPRIRVGRHIPVPKSPVRAVGVVAAIAILLVVAVAGIGLSLAVFTAQTDQVALFGSKAVFLGERVTPAFQVGDASSGIEVDRSSPFAFPADGLTTTTSAWSTAFAADRYLEFELNDSLASDVAVSTASFAFRFASSGAGQACFYFEVRRISTGAVLATHGSSGSPVGCVTGTTPATFSTSIPSVTTTSIANDLRIRVFGRESGGAASVIDLAAVAGSTVHQSFTLYPVLFRDAADTTADVIPWGLDVP